MAPARLAAVLLLGLAALPARAADEAQLKRGEVLFQAADCVACHTDVKGGGRPLAGGRPLTTPFGVFFSPNISPDWQTGIGSWSEAEFRRALRKGVGRHRQYLFPVFPYPAFTGMTDADIGDLLAYLRTRTPVEQLNKPHQLRFPFGWRTLLFFWRRCSFARGRCCRWRARAPSGIAGAISPRRWCIARNATRRAISSAGSSAAGRSPATRKVRMA